MLEKHHPSSSFSTLGQAKARGLVHVTREPTASRRRDGPVNFNARDGLPSPSTHSTLHTCCPSPLETVPDSAHCCQSKQHWPYHPNWPGGVVVPSRCTGRHAALYTIGKKRSCGMALSLSIDPNRCPSAPDSSQVRGLLSDPPQRGPSRADEKVNDPCTINASDQRPAVRLTSVRDEADLLA